MVGSGGRGVVRVEGDKENYNNYKLIGAVLGQHFIITGTTTMRGGADFTVTGTVHNETGEMHWGTYPVITHVVDWAQSTN